MWCGTKTVYLLVAFAQLTAELASKGKTVWDQLESIYREHGLYINAQRSIALQPGTPPIGDSLRASPPSHIAGRGVDIVDDLKTSKRTYSDGQTEAIDLPPSDVLIYHLMMILELSLGHQVLSLN